MNSLFRPSLEGAIAKYVWFEPGLGQVTFMYRRAEGTASRLMEMKTRADTTLARSIVQSSLARVAWHTEMYLKKIHGKRVSTRVKSAHA